MSGFYVSLIFFGILLVLFSLVCIFLDKKKVFDFSKNFDGKKQELVEIINDAEQMIEELNKFSDYVVNQMDLKNEELMKNLKSAEEKINALSEKAKSAVSEVSVAVSHVPVTVSEAVSEKISATYTEAAVSFVSSTINEEHTVLIEPVEIAVNSGVTDVTSHQRIPARKSEKVIPINNKYSEVIRLSQEGMYGFEIAKKLNIGKGEVELILGLRK